MIYRANQSMDYSCASWGQHCTTHHAREDGRGDSDYGEGKKQRKQPKTRPKVIATKRVCRDGESVHVAKKKTTKKK